MTRLPHDLAGRWKWILARGALAVLFGVAAFVVPGVSLLAIVLIWGAYAIADGVLALVTGWKSRDAGRAIWPFLVLGVLGIAAGAIALFRPDVAATGLVLVVAVWSIVGGILQIVVAIRLRAALDNEWLLVAAGLMAVAFGALLAFDPAAGALSLVWILGAFALVYGALLVTLALRLRGRAATQPHFARVR